MWHANKKDINKKILISDRKICNTNSISSNSNEEHTMRFQNNNVEILRPSEFIKARKCIKFGNFITM